MEWQRTKKCSTGVISSIKASTGVSRSVGLGERVIRLRDGPAARLLCESSAAAPVRKKPRRVVVMTLKSGSINNLPIILDGPLYLPQSLGASICRWLEE